MLEPIGKHIRLVDQRNGKAGNLPLMGVSIEKVFMPSVANTIGSNMANYKVVKQGQFACSLMQVRRDKKMPVALLRDYEEAIVSPAYPVFEIIDEGRLLPEYLMMWMLRPEFDREACFYAVGGVRGSLEWDDLCHMQLPVPPIEKQREIVKEYRTVVDRIRLNERLSEKLEEAAQTIYRQWFVEFEFPMTDEYAESIGKPELAGQPYRSSGGEMGYNEVLEREIPKGWAARPLDTMVVVKGGKRLPAGESLVRSVTEHPYIKVANLGNRKFVTLTSAFEYLEPATQSRISRYVVEAGDLVVSIVGTIGLAKLIDESLDGANLTENCAKLTTREMHTDDLLYHFLVSQAGQKEIEMRTVGGVQGKLPLYNIASLPCVFPQADTREAFAERIQSINRLIAVTQRESDVLARLGSLLLASIASKYHQ